MKTASNKTLTMASAWRRVLISFIGLMFPPTRLTKLYLCTAIAGVWFAISLAVSAVATNHEKQSTPSHQPHCLSATAKAPIKAEKA